MTLGLALVVMMLLCPATSTARADTPRVLILAGTVTGGAASIEATEAAAQGMAVDIVDGTTWAGMTAAQFSSYRAIVLGDPTCASSAVTPDIQAAASNAKVWGPVINGNIVILGTDPVFHASQGGATVTQRGIDYAINQAGKTGAYISLSCYYESSPAGTPVPVLDGIAGGNFKVGSASCYNDAHIVAVSPALSGLTDADLSNWSCSVHEVFQNWNGSLIPLAIAKDYESNYTASDGTQGAPYILAGGNIQSFPLSLSPLSGTATAGASYTVTATLLDASTRAPVSGAHIVFKVVSGPNAGNVLGTCSTAKTGTVSNVCTTATDGTASWTYPGKVATGLDTIQGFYDKNGNAFADAGEPLTTAGVTWTAAPARGIIAALGDSFSSGEGDSPFLSGSDTSVDTCHRSNDAYAPRISSLYHSHPTLGVFVACSGSITYDLSHTNHQNSSERAQLDQIPSDATLVTLTIGGNDLGFPSVLAECLKEGTLNPNSNVSCGNSSQAKDTLKALTALEGGKSFSVKPDPNKPATYPVIPWSQVFALIHQHAKNAQILVAGYPKLVDPYGQKFNWLGFCFMGWGTSPNNPTLAAPVFISSASAQWISSTVDSVNSGLRSVANSFSYVHYVDPQVKWADQGGHSLCDATPWLYNASVKGTLGSLNDSVTYTQWPGTAHPTASGQLYGYEGAFADVLNTLP